MPPPMPDARLELPNGKHAEFQVHPTHAEYRKAFQAIARITEAEMGDKLAIMVDLSLIFLVSWNAVDRDGKELGLTADDFERCPQDTLTAVYNRATEIFKAIPTPKLS